MMRGGHIDLCVLGAFEVAANGSSPTGAPSSHAIPAVGSAMDLAVGAEVYVTMEHTTKPGAPKMVEASATRSPAWPA